MLLEAIERVERGEHLSQPEMREVVSLLMLGRASDLEIERLLLGLRAKGEAADEIAGAAAAMRDHMVPIRHSRPVVIDTCGTGGDGSGTFNISTAAAIVTAASGVAVAKHGNRSISSRSGSADVLAVLGIKVDAPVEVVEHCFEELGICFCFAVHLHPAMKYVGPTRKRLAVPTIFNLLGPLCNPAGAPFQVLGVGKPHLRPLLASAIARLGTRHSLVVSGDDGLDEVTLETTTRVSEVQGDSSSGGGAEVTERTLEPEKFGLPRAGKETMQIDGPEGSAKIIAAILEGERGACRDVVVLNAAAALWTSGIDRSELVCAEIAAESIDSGKAKKLLAQWQAMSHRAS